MEYILLHKYNLVGNGLFVFVYLIYLRGRDNGKKKTVQKHAKVVLIIQLTGWFQGKIPFIKVVEES